MPSMLLFWIAGLAQGLAIATPGHEWAMIPVSIFATACFALAAIIAPKAEKLNSD